MAFKQRLAAKEDSGHIRYQRRGLQTERQAQSGAAFSRQRQPACPWERPKDRYVPCMLLIQATRGRKAFLDHG